MATNDAGTILEGGDHQEGLGDRRDTSVPPEGVGNEKMPCLAKALQNQTHGSIMEAADASNAPAFSGSVGSGGCFTHRLLRL